VLLTVQLVTLWQAGFRGLDYLTAPGGRAALDTAAADPLAGGMLYAGVLLALLGIAARLPGPAIAGHALLAAWYTGLGMVTLLDGHTLTLAGVVGAGIGVTGVALVLHPRVRAAVRLLAGVPLMLGGQYVLAADLGSDYRTGTGLVGAGLLHAALAVGTFILWQRRELRQLVDREVPRAG